MRWAVGRLQALQEACCGGTMDMDAKKDCRPTAQAAVASHGTACISRHVLAWQAAKASSHLQQDLLFADDVGGDEEKLGVAGSGRWLREASSSTSPASIRCTRQCTCSCSCRGGRGHLFVVPLHPMLVPLCLMHIMVHQLPLPPIGPQATSISAFFPLPGAPLTARPLLLPCFCTPALLPHHTQATTAHSSSQAPRNRFSHVLGAHLL